MKYFSLISILILLTISGFSQWEDPQINQWKSQQDNRLTQVHRAADDYNVKFYFLDVAMDDQSIAIEGTAQIDLVLTNGTASAIELDFDNAMSVSAVRKDGMSSGYEHSNNIISIPLSKARTEDLISIEVDFSGNPPYGMFHGTDDTWSTSCTFSLSEPFDAMGWFPVKQDLTDKADSSWVFVTVPDHLMAGSNGLLDQVVDNGDGTETYQWKSSYPIDYYLISVAIADYTDTSIYAHPEQSEDSILIQNFVYNSDGYLATNEWSMNQSIPIMEALCDALGLYPHHEEKYGHCIVELNGGMEHQTMTSIRDFGFALVAHEMGHSWFGNYVTCGTWQDIWINEGFAVYSEYITYEAMRTEAEQRNYLQLSMNQAKTYDNGSVYVPIEEANSVSRIFNYYLTYKKGGMLVHMIRYLIDDDEVFFQVLHEFLATYGNSTANGEDFRAVLETVSGLDFESFFDEYYYGEGYPEYNINWYQNNNTVYIESNQTTSASETPLFTIPLEYRLFFSDGDSLSVRLANTSNSEIFELASDRQVTNIEVDPDIWVLCDKNIQQVESIPTQEINLKVYPNPFTSSFTIETGSFDQANFTIVNADGKILYQGSMKNGFLNIDLSDLPMGVYYLTVESNKQKLQRKKIVKI